MKKYLLIAVYLTGCFVSYFTSREFIKSTTSAREYTIGDRTFAISMSVLSWASVVSVGIATVIDNTKNNDEPAKW